MFLVLEIFVNAADGAGSIGRAPLSQFYFISRQNKCIETVFTLGVMVLSLLRSK